MADLDLHYLYEAGDPGVAPLLLLHGHGGSERDLVPVAHLLRPHAPLLSIRGRITEAGQTRYYRHAADGGVDLTSLTGEVEWLLTTVASLADRHDLDLTGLTVVGFSNGANLAAHALMTRPTPFATAVLCHPTTLAATHIRAVPAARVWLSHGAQDPLVPSATFAALTAALEATGGAVTTYESAGGHGLNDAEVKAAHDWLNQQEA